MVRRKSVRTRGKISLSANFQKFKEGDAVAVKIERAVEVNFPKRLQGRTGKVQGKQGKSYMVEIKDQNKPKRFLIAPVHLKKIKQVTKND